MKIKARLDPEEEPVADAMWHILEEMVGHCQATVKDRVGIFVRQEGARVEQKVAVVKLIRTYAKGGSMAKANKVWQQITMFPPGRSRSILGIVLSTT